MDDDADVESDNIPEQMLTEPPQHPDVRRRIRIQYRTLLNDVSSEYDTGHFNRLFLVNLQLPLDFLPSEGCIPEDWKYFLSRV